MFVSNNFGITQLYKVFRSFTVHWKKMVQNVNTSFLFPFFFKRHTFNFNNGENTMLTFCALGSLIRITNIETTAFIVSFQDQSHGAIEWTLCGTCPTDEKNGRANAGHTWKKIVSTCIPAGKKQNHIIPIIPCHRGTPTIINTTTLPTYASRKAVLCCTYHGYLLQGLVLIAKLHLHMI